MEGCVEKAEGGEKNLPQELRLGEQLKLLSGPKNRPKSSRSSDCCLGEEFGGGGGRRGELILYPGGSGRNSHSFKCGSTGGQWASRGELQWHNSGQAARIAPLGDSATPRWDGKRSRKERGPSTPPTSPTVAHSIPLKPLQTE